MNKLITGLEVLGIIVLCWFAASFLWATATSVVYGGVPITQAAMEKAEHRWWYVNAQWDELGKYYTIGPIPTKRMCQQTLSTWMMSNAQAATNSEYYNRWWHNGPSSVQCVCAWPGLRYQEVEFFMEDLAPEQDCQLE